MYFDVMYPKWYLLATELGWGIWIATLVILFTVNMVIFAEYMKCRYRVLYYTALYVIITFVVGMVVNYTMPPPIYFGIK